jgi:hypothetical protein
MMVKQATVVVVHVELRGQTKLALVGQTRGLVTFRLGSRQGRQEQSSQYGDNGDDHQQFNQREARASIRSDRRASADFGIHGLLMLTFVSR